MGIQKIIDLSKKYQIQVAFLLIFASSLFLFYPSLNYYFFQDDWFVLNWVRTGNLASFFEFRTDIIYWRPLSMPIFFLLGKTLFSLNSFGYHVIAFFIFFLLIIFVYKLFSLLLNDRKVALLLAFLYAIWPIHFMSLSWLSTTSYLFGALFQAGAFISFIRFVSSNKSFYWYVSLASFLLAILSSELALVLPLIILIWGLLIKKQNYLKILLPFLLINGLYLFVRFIVAPLPAREDYQIQINHLVIDNLFWYLAWSFNLPESFKELIDQSFPIKSLRTLAQFWQITITSLVLVIINVRLIVNKIDKNLKFILFGLIFFVAGLMPVIFLPHHSFNIYLTFAGLGLLLIFGLILKNSAKIWWFFISFSWILSSLANLSFIRNTHWITNEQSISKAYIEYTQKTVNNPESNAVFLFRPPDKSFSESYNFLIIEGEKTISQSLNNDDAIQVIYDDTSLKSIFLENLERLNLNNNLSVYEIIPRLDNQKI